MKISVLFLFICTGFITGVFAQVPVADFSGTPRTICAGQSVTWTNLTTGAFTYTWSFPGASGGTTSNMQIPYPKIYNTPGTYSVSLIAMNFDGNDTMQKTDYITVLAKPAISVTPSAGSICTLGEVILTASGGNSYLWTPSTGLDNTSGSSVVASPNISTTYTVTGTDLHGCTGKTNVEVTVNTNHPPTPGGITGLKTVCNGQSGVVYSVPGVTNASIYTWAVPAGATIAAGQGTTTIAVTFGSSSGTVSVTADNSCGKSMPSSQVVTVAPTAAVGSVGTINGLRETCANQSLVNYYLVPVANATNYNWTVPAGASITAGQGTSTITVTLGSASGNICVDASNSCSTTLPSCDAIKVSPNVPVIPGSIAGVTTVCNGQYGVLYSIAPVANASTYTWATPPGGKVTAGQGTTTATITFGSASGNIGVASGNACGVSLPSNLAINVDPNHAVGKIDTIIGAKAACANLTNVTYTIPAVANAVAYNWTVPSTATITAGQGTNTITVSFGSVSGNICAEASNACGSSPQRCMMVTVSPNAPSIPSGITGATTVCPGQVRSYSVTPATDVLSYQWTVPAGAIIASGQGTNHTVLTFGKVSGNLCVSAANGCGTSLQNCKVITVNDTLLTISATVSNATNSSACDGSATAKPSGATGPYTYAWAPSGASTSTATGLCVGSHTVCITNAGGCVTCKNVNVSSPTAINALTDNGTIQVFPNPANDYIFIEGTLSGAANLQINILNMFGQKVLDKSLYATGEFNDKISIGNIPAGVYSIELHSGEFVRNTKIIKIQ